MKAYLKYGILLGFVHILSTLLYLFSDVSGNITFFLLTIFPLIFIVFVGMLERKKRDVFSLGIVIKLFFGIIAVAQIMRFVLRFVIALIMTEESMQKLTLEHIEPKNDNAFYNDFDSSFDYRPFEIDNELLFSSNIIDLFVEPLVFIFLIIIPSIFIKKNKS